MRSCSTIQLLVILAFAGRAISADPAVVIRWDFGAEETSPLRSHGGVHRDVPGPRPPDYPDFEPNNTAVKLDGMGALLSFEDTGTSSQFDFTNGDSIALEAWVQVDELRRGENVYVVGKGRTGAAGFASDNQNWAIRVRESKGKACVSFLFATAAASGATKTDDHWHRWTTSDGFEPGKTWHHIAVSYQFGSPQTIRGWIDGKPQPGKWDMGGATDEPPIVDDDSIWIGSSRGGAAANSLRGCLDAIAIHRQQLDDNAMASRYRFAGKEVVVKPAQESMPEPKNLPQGAVLVLFREGMPAHDRWLNEDEVLPEETTRMPANAFLIDRLPLRFDDWGIRQSWKAPVLAQFFADVQLSPGQHRFLMRVRGLSRLWVNGQVIARSEPLLGSPNGEEPMTPVASPPLPGLRIAEHRQQEVFGDAMIGADGRCRVVLETMIGAKNFRIDPGELCVAVESDDGETFFIVQGTDAIATEGPLRLTDTEVVPALKRLEADLRRFDDQSRRAAAASQDEYWAMRHQVARDWANENPVPMPSESEAHPIDAMIRRKIERSRVESAKTPAAEAKQFHELVLPILREGCFRCHGDKQQGGLRLNSREAALKGGDSESPAILPGKVAESELIRRIRSDDPSERMPPGGEPLPADKISALVTWVEKGAAWPPPPIPAEDTAWAPLLGDAAFLRRVFLDTVGEPPTEQEVREFLSDSSSDKRSRMIDRLLADQRCADHWMSYWQDVLAENPTLINASLNTTGPFRWFLYDALRDGKAFDRLVTELIMLRGSPHEGGSAGFAIAADNDAPLAAKGQIVATAFLGIELQCARCHDSPYHSTKQRDLYAVAAMFNRQGLTVSKTSRVPAAFFEKKSRESLIQVTLKPDETVPPAWPFAEVTGVADDESLAELLQNPSDSRERLAGLITSPANRRFAPAVVNRIWRRLMGAGLVEPPHDWEGHAPSHPELLAWLAQEFIKHDYDLHHVTRLILNSRVYQSEATGKNLGAAPETRFFAAPDRRRLTAEQIVDSLLAASGRTLDVEELTFDPDGRRPASNRLTLGNPERAWMFASLANERDRPALSLPRARAIADVLEAFGWTGSRQNPKTDRETAPNALQPGVLANSTALMLLTRVTEECGLAEDALTASSAEELVDRIFLRYLSRFPTNAERGPLADVLSIGFNDRILLEKDRQKTPKLEPLPRVTWSNHLRAEATTIALENERRAAAGPPPDSRLQPEWRERFEDVIWSVVNIREFVWMP